MGNEDEEGKDGRQEEGPASKRRPGVRVQLEVAPQVCVPMMQEFSRVFICCNAFSKSSLFLPFL